MPTASHAKRGIPDYVQEKSYGETNTGPKVLFAFATNYGSTYRIAEVICEVLKAENFKVDLKFAENITGDLSQYDAVILGSNIYIEKWNTKAMAFLDEYKTELATKKVAYYCVCMILGMDLGGKEKDYAANYLKLISDNYSFGTVAGATVFPGAVNYRILKPVDWILLHSMFAAPGYWTDFGDVAAWAFELSDKLK